MKKPLITLLAMLLLFTLAEAQQQAPLLPHQQHTTAQQPNPATQFPDGSAHTNSVLSYHIINAPNNTYCYDVLVDGRLMIHQTRIPGVPGNEGFKTNDDAAKVVEMVMYKIRNGEMPPTVSADEMKNTGQSDNSFNMQSYIYLILAKINSYVTASSVANSLKFTLETRV
jgi:hypothetical protein